MKDSLRKINPFLHDKLLFTNEQKEFVLDARDLLSPNRFDVIAKYLYIKYKNQGLKTVWAKNLYTEHMRAFSNGTFREGDNLGKNSIEDYLRTFDELIGSIRNKGFDENVSVLPVTPNKIIIDGSHRLAAALYFCTNVSCLEFTEPDPNYNYECFMRKGLSINFCDAIALEYIRTCPKTYVVIIYPSAAGKEKAIQDILLNHGKIFYRKEIFFNANGSINLVRQLYYGEPWAGDDKKMFLNERNKAELCFKNNGPLRLFIVESDDPLNIVAAKEKIRSLFNIENHSIHTIDKRDDTLRIAEQLLNENSIQFLNLSTYGHDAHFEKLFFEFKEWVRTNNLNKDHFCIDGSSVLCIYNIRKAFDLDVLHAVYPEMSTQHDLIGSHNEELKYYKRHVDDIVHNPDNHFYYNGIKFVSLDLLKEMKTVRNELKDKQDVILINNLVARHTDIVGYLRRKYYGCLRFRQKLPHKIKNIVKTVVPERFHLNVLRTYLFLRWILDIPFLISHHTGRFERQRKYLGFILHYTRGYSLIRRIIKKRIYEPQLTAKLVESIKETKSDYFLDIGANIGLISLNVIYNIPDLKIFAFEAGPLQSKMFGRTIKDNRLEDRIELFRIAVSDKAGVCDFAIHKSRHASGDGFLNTNRAGKVEYIEVETQTIDNWWKEKNCPTIKIMKIDTEGAELLVLKGATEFIKKCKPSIIIEINKLNLKPYPYNEYDIIKFFEENNYFIKMFDGKLITKNNFEQYLNITDEFIAYPLHR